jgi:hypothetical protein
MWRQSILDGPVWLGCWALGACVHRSSRCLAPIDWVACKHRTTNTSVPGIKCTDLYVASAHLTRLQHGVRLLAACARVCRQLHRRHLDWRWRLHCNEFMRVAKQLNDAEHASCSCTWHQGVWTKRSGQLTESTHFFGKPFAEEHLVHDGTPCTTCACLNPFQTAETSGNVP